MPVCARARVSTAPRHSWLGCWGVCVFVCPLRLYPATPGWGVWCGCVCLGWGFSCAPPLLAGVLGCVCVLVPAPLVPRHSWFGCAAWVCVLGPGFQVCPATPGCGVGVCACSCARCACTPPLLACVCGVSVCAWAPVSAAPRHSWLGCFGVCVLVCAPRLYPAIPGSGVRRACVCSGSGFGCAPPLQAGRWGLCVFVCPLRLYPATPGWGVRRGCVCLGPGFGCAPPLLAVVLGCVRVLVPTPLVPHHSWLGCAAWLCVLGLGFRLRPASPGWGVGVCVCSCAPSVFTPPLLAGVCGVGVCAWAWVSAAPRHSWLRCWGVCVFVCPLSLFTPLLAGMCGACVCIWASGSAAPRNSWLECPGVCVFVCPLRLYPATPGWGVRRGCVCFGLGLGCAPPLLAGVLGFACARVPAPLVPGHCWLGFVVWVCVLGLGFWLRPATPGWGVGACVCSCAPSACTPPLLAGVCRVGMSLGPGFGCAPPGLAGVLGCVCVCVPAPLVHATPGWGVWCVCVCSDSGFCCAPALLVGVVGCVRVCVPAPLVPRHSWLGCVVWVGVFRLWFRPRPASPGWGVGLGVCSCAPSACTTPLLAGVCGVGVYAWASVSGALRHSWLGCLGVCVFVCPLCLFPATPGWGVWCVCVCLGSSFGCAPPLLAGVLGYVCVRVPAPLVPRHSWLGCAPWLCVLWLAFRLRPATPGWNVWVCVCWCACSGCTSPLLAGVCGVGVCAWARVLAASRHSSLRCWGVCVFVCALRWYPATPGWGVWCVCVCSGSGFGCAPPLLAGVLGCVCVRVPPSHQQPPPPQRRPPNTTPSKPSSTSPSPTDHHHRRLNRPSDVGPLDHRHRQARPPTRPPCPPNSTAPGATHDARPPTPTRQTGIRRRGPRELPATPTAPLPTPPPPAAPPPPLPPPPLPLPTTLPHQATTPRARTAPAYGMAVIEHSTRLPHLPAGANPPVPATPPVPGTVSPR